MRSRLVLVVAIAIAVVAVVFAVLRFTPASSPPVVHASLPHKSESYLGVYEAGAPPAYQPVQQFAAAAGRQPNLVGYYSGWVEPFPAAFAGEVRARGATPLVQIDPTLASVPGIAAGDYDGYLRSYADSVRGYGHAVVIGFGHEMNGNWYSWGYGHVPPRTFIAAWRHIVTLFRGQGADNVTWLWTIEADHRGTGPISEWWPGSKYVTWVGIDGYYYRSSSTFATVFGPTIRQVRKFTGKPVLLSETAVGPDAGQFAKITNLFAGMRKYGTLGLVWFDIKQDKGIFHQDWRLEDSFTAETAFRLGVANLTLARQ
jgi:mannan endo-1,4-beta-mannosidase